MANWDIVGTDLFADWYGQLDVNDQAAVERVVGILEAIGPHLGRPYADHIYGSRFPNMKELRAQSSGKPLRIFFAFDPMRAAVLLLGGDKTGDGRFYERMIPIADKLLETYLKEMEQDDG